MIVKPVLGTVLLWAMLALVSIAIAAEKRPKAQQFLHFGNMGGVMPDLKATDLPEPNSEGAEYLRVFCSQCHNMPGPGMRTQKEWSRIYWDMYWRMHIMNSQFDNFLVPTYGQGDTLFKYLLRNALKPAKLTSIAQGEVGATEYGRTCIQCHQLPDPRQHTSDEWPKVVQRMKRHMHSMGKIAPSKQEEKRIVTYLSSMAGK